MSDWLAVLAEVANPVIAAVAVGALSVTIWQAKVNERRFHESLRQS